MGRTGRARWAHWPLKGRVILLFSVPSPKSKTAQFTGGQRRGIGRLSLGCQARPGATHQMRVPFGTWSPVDCVPRYGRLWAAQNAEAGVKRFHRPVGRTMLGQSCYSLPAVFRVSFSCSSLSQPALDAWWRLRAGPDSSFGARCRTDCSEFYFFKFFFLPEWTTRQAVTLPNRHSRLGLEASTRIPYGS